MIRKICRSIKEVGFLGSYIKTLGVFGSKITEDRQIYFGVKKRIRRFLDEENTYLCDVTPIKRDDNKTIWVAWFQGEDSMPPLVKKCYENLCKIEEDHNIVLITYENLFEYVNIPEHIMEKRNNGNITVQQFSDIVRTALLYQNGGLWIDSTMWLSEKIPEVIWKQGYFVFRYYDDNIYQIGSSQFIRAEAGNEILGQTLELLYKYWKRYNKAVSYYQWHYFVTLVIESKDKYIRMIKDMPRCYAENNHALQQIFFEKYSKEHWEYIKSLSFVHKLTHKNLPCQQDAPGTYYEMFMKGQL